MLYAHLDSLRKDLDYAKAKGDEMMIWTFEREIETTEMLIGEMERMNAEECFA